MLVQAKNEAAMTKREVVKAMKRIPGIEKRVIFTNPALPVELWRQIAEEIPDVQTLNSLTQVCSGLRNILMPILYEAYIIDSFPFHRSLKNEANLFSVPPGVEHTKYFSFTFRDKKDDERGNYGSLIRGGYLPSVSPPRSTLASVLQVLTLMPHLETLCVYDFDNSRQLSITIQAFLDVLHKNKKFKYLTVDLTAHKRDYGEHNIQFSQLPNIVSLDIRNLAVKNRTELGSMAKSLAGCRKLEKLTLGLSDKKAWSPNWYLESLCEEYHATVGSVPLSLKELRLKGQIGLCRQVCPSPTHYLERLVKLEVLEKLDLSDPLSTSHSLGCLRRKKLSNLRQLRIFDLKDRDLSWLSLNDPSYPQMKELFVKEWTSAYFHWESFHLSTLFLHFRDDIARITPLNQFGSRVHVASWPANLNKLGVKIWEGDDWDGVPDDWIPPLRQLTHLRIHLKFKQWTDGRPLNRLDDLAACAIAIAKKHRSLRHIMLQTRAWHISRNEETIILEEMKTKELMSIELFVAGEDGDNHGWASAPALRDGNRY